MRSTFEVGVIGAGVHGASVAFHLASRGVKVVVIEQGAAAGGPTGRSSAICRAYYTNQYLARVAKASLDMFRSFGELTGGRRCDFHAAGALYLHPASDAPGLEEAASYMNSIGTRVKVLSPAQVQADFPLIDAEGVGIAGWEEQAGYADPAATTVGLLERAVELGALARLYTQVLSLRSRAGSGARLVLAGGDELECERLLIAAGPWTKKLAAHVADPLPLTVERHYVATIRWPDAREMPFVHADIASGYYCKPEGADMYCLGPLTAEAEADPDQEVAGIDAGETHRMAELATRRVPRLKDAVSAGGWASLYDVSPDWMPVIGEIAPGVFVDAGTSGHGFKLAPALGADVAALVMGGAVDDDIRQLSPARFASGGSLPAGYGSARILG
ncbi:MAG TPA: FAD-binding oxidoreductase [Candidatus Dormibacteraeota bacterium]|nr:FAD-binding oxidoreductase [Candidatus Dormibacteraeota bacterium]